MPARRCCCSSRPRSPRRSRCRSRTFGPARRPSRTSSSSLPPSSTAGRPRSSSACSRCCSWRSTPTRRRSACSTTPRSTRSRRWPPGSRRRSCPSSTALGSSARSRSIWSIALLAAAVALIRKQSYATILRSFYASTLVPFGVMAATSAILVHLWMDSPWWALLIVPPLVAVGLHQRSLLATLARQRELDRMKDEFMAVISHELRTPLATVYGAAITLEERDLDEAMQRRLINLIRRESARQTKIVSDVLWASRLDAHKAAGRLQTLDIAAIAREVAATAAESAPESISLEVEADELPVAPGRSRAAAARSRQPGRQRGQVLARRGGRIRVTLEAQNGAPDRRRLRPGPRRRGGRP